MAEFNTTPKSYDAEAFDTAERLAFLTSWGAAQVDGDSAQDFAVKDIMGTGRHCLTTGNNFYFAYGYTATPSVDINYDIGGGLISSYRFRNGQQGFANVQASSFTPFTGCHIIPNEGQDFKIGELICIEAIENEDKKQPDWKGKYAKKNKKGIFGIVFDEYEEPKNIPEVGMNKFYSIACLGDMKVLCNNENGNIKYGDELCASSIKGQAMKADEDIHRRKVCGIAGRSYTFTGDETILMDTTKE